MFEYKKQLKKAIKLYCSNREKCIAKYGQPNDWDVSKITNMHRIFYGSDFDGDISNWDVSKVTDMRDMFCYSYFRVVGKFLLFRLYKLNYNCSFEQLKDLIDYKP